MLCLSLLPSNVCFKLLAYFKPIFHKYPKSLLMPCLLKPCISFVLSKFKCFRSTQLSVKDICNPSYVYKWSTIWIWICLSLPISVNDAKKERIGNHFDPQTYWKYPTHYHISDSYTYRYKSNVKLSNFAFGFKD